MPALRAIALAFMAALSPPARGAEPPIPLRYTLALDGSIVAAEGLTGALLTIYRPELLPSTCRWCTPPAIDASARDALVWNDRARTADTLSTVVDIVLPASAATYLLLAASRRGDVHAGLVDTLLVTEVAAATVILNLVVKVLVGRQRPYAFLKHDVGYSEGEDNLSFYGGHTSFAFSVVAATVTVASMRGYAGTEIAGGVGATLAAGVGYLRIAADQHYLTDVLVGAAVGGLLGWAIPRVSHSPGQTSSARAGLRGPPIGLSLAF